MTVVLGAVVARRFVLHHPLFIVVKHVPFLFLFFSVADFICFLIFFFNAALAHAHDLLQFSDESEGIR